MTTITRPEIDLFTSQAFTYNDICTWADYVNASERNKINFAEQIEQAKAGSAGNLSVGCALAIIGQYAAAAETLEKTEDSKIKFIELAYAYKKLGKFDQSIAALDKAGLEDPEDLHVALEKANIFRLKRDFDAASAQLKSCEKFEKVSPEYHYTVAKFLQVQGLYEEAIENYESALEIDPTYAKALFHLAFLLDLRGDEDAAIDYYKQLLNGSCVYVSALLNLAVLYEDKGQYQKALNCVSQVLDYHPNNQRAILFSKDIESSMTMLYDEDKEKSKDMHNRILETPVSDFELSVRSRNCLRKMNLNTIGDLLKITETELLAYKNFGETSLNEIKRVLDTKGLRLGMAVEEAGGATVQPIDIEAEVDVDQELLNKSLDDFELSVRAKKCLDRLNINTVGALVSKTEAELLGVKNFGVTSLIEIKQILESIGLSLRKLE